MDRKIKIGDAVVFIAPDRTERTALVTHVWGNETYPDHGGTKPGLNVVFVVNDPARQDQYGTQLQRETSVCHQSVNPAGCNAWRECQ